MMSNVFISVHNALPAAGRTRVDYTMLSHFQQKPTLRTIFVLKLSQTAQHCIPSVHTVSVKTLLNDALVFKLSDV